MYKFDPLRYIFALLTVLIWAGTAEAQGPGIRGGVSIDPDQGYFGAHYETGALVDRLHFRPNVEAGLGDDLTTISLNFEFAYKFPTRNALAAVRRRRAGGELLHLRHRGRRRRTETDAGLNFLFGVEQRSGLFFEFKLGVIDSPEVKFGVG